MDTYSTVTIVIEQLSCCSSRFSYLLYITTRLSHEHVLWAGAWIVCIIRRCVSDSCILNQFLLWIIYTYLALKVTKIQNPLPAKEKSGLNQYRLPASCYDVGWTCKVRFNDSCRSYNIHVPVVLVIIYV